MLKVSIEFYSNFFIALAIYVSEGVDFRFFEKIEMLDPLKLCKAFFCKYRQKNHGLEKKIKN